MRQHIADALQALGGLVVVAAAFQIGATAGSFVLGVVLVLAGLIVASGAS